MKHINKYFYLLIATPILGLFFQNCGKGFISQNNELLLSSSSANSFQFFAPQVSFFEGRNITNKPKPTLVVEGLPNNFKIQIFLDSFCKSPVASGVIASGRSAVNIENTLKDGDYKFFINYTTSEDLKSLKSPCYDTEKVLTVKTSLPDAPSKISFVLPALASEPNQDTNNIQGQLDHLILNIQSATLKSGYLVKVFTTPTCNENSLAGEAQAFEAKEGRPSNYVGGINVPIKIPTEKSPQKFSFYANVTDSAKNVSLCSLVSVDYTFDTNLQNQVNEGVKPKVIKVQYLSNNLTEQNQPIQYLSVDKSVNFSIIMSEVVKVTGAPRILLNASSKAYAQFVSVQGNSIIFKYTITAGDNSMRLNNESLIDLNGGSLKSVSGLDADLILPDQTSFSDLASSSNVVIDTTAPDAPSNMALQNPSSGRDILLQPSISISPTEKDFTISLFLDSECKSKTGSIKAQNSSVTMTSEVLKNTALPAVVKFYSQATDLAGNVSVCSTVSISYNLDPPNPYVFSISNLTLKSADQLPYATGAVIEYAFKFSREIKLTPGSGAPSITINATTKPIFAEVSSQAKDTLIFKYTVAPEDFADPVKILSSILVLNSSSLTDTTGQFPARLEIPVEMINSLLPTAVSVDATSPKINLIKQSTASNSRPQLPILTIESSKPIKSAQLFSDSQCRNLVGSSQATPISTNPVNYLKTIDIQVTNELAVNQEISFYSIVSDRTNNNSTCSAGSLLFIYKYTPIVSLGSGASANSTCGITLSGSVACWGDNTYGQLGNGNRESQSNPSYIQGLNNVKSVSVGMTSACALISDGTIKCWGDNRYGQLGNGTNATNLQPVTVSGITTARKVDVGMYRACAELLDSSYHCWGFESGSAESLTSIKFSNIPVKIMDNVQSSHFSSNHAFIVTTDSNPSGFAARTQGLTTLIYPKKYCNTSLDCKEKGSLFSFEFTLSLKRPNIPPKSMGHTGHSFMSFDTGELTYVSFASISYSASGEEDTSIYGPRLNYFLAANNNPLKASDAGGYHFCFTRSENTLFCMGDNSYGQLGRGSISGFRVDMTTAFRVAQLGVVSSFALGRAHSCAISNGSVYCWGDNTYRQLGNGSPVSNTVPTGIDASTSSYSSTPLKINGF